jgi:hypothetical protein
LKRYKLTFDTISLKHLVFVYARRMLEIRALQHGAASKIKISLTKEEKHSD